MTGTSRSGPDSPVPADGFDPRSVPHRDAATVMVIRDGAEGLEVFMLRRTLAAVFAGGMFVFPGGAVDDADRSPDVESWCDGLDDRQASRLLAVDEGGLGFWIAAIRECFEEAGVLLARGSDGDVVRFDDPTSTALPGLPRCRPPWVAALGGAVRHRGASPHDGRHSLREPLDHPDRERRRFDTPFFVARAPEAQQPLHDDHETIASLWVRRPTASTVEERGELAMITPTRNNLDLLVPHATAEDSPGGPGRDRATTHHPAEARGSTSSSKVVMPTDPDFADLPELG